MELELEVDIHFGKVDKSLIDWRNEEVRGEDEDNDEDFAVDKDVKRILGFDPDKENS